MGTRRHRPARISALSTGLVLATGVAMVVVASRAGAARTDAALCSGATAIMNGHSLSSAQIGNARLIYRVAAGEGLPGRASVIGIATAMQESGLRNVPYGTSDSLGLFQQRPSRGWGTPAQVMRPRAAAAAFYARLVQLPGWQTLPLTVAAQDVQHSAYPDAYSRWERLAADMTAAFSDCAAP